MPTKLCAKLASGNNTSKVKATPKYSSHSGQVQCTAKKKAKKNTKYLPHDIIRLHDFSQNTPGEG